jgi:hypothetical protein
MRVEFAKTVEAFPFVFSLSSDCPELYEELEALTGCLPLAPPGVLPDLRYRIESTPLGYLLRRNEAVFAGAVPRCGIFLAIQENISRHLRTVDGLVILHAAAVIKDGQALILAGGKQTGKSSVTALLLECGFQFLSDEFVAVNPNGTIRAHRFPLRLRRSALRLLPPLMTGIRRWPVPFPIPDDEVSYGVPDRELLASDQNYPVGLILFPRGFSRNWSVTRYRRFPEDSRTMAFKVQGKELLAKHRHNRHGNTAVFNSTASLLCACPCYNLILRKGELARPLIEHLWDVSVSRTPLQEAALA